MVGFGPTHVGSNPTGAILQEARKMKYLRISASELERMCDRLAHMVNKEFKPDCIVGVARGGLFPAVYLSDRLGVKRFFTIRVEQYKGTKRMGRALVRQKPPLSCIHGNVLIVDDVADSGETLALVKKMLEKHSKNIKTATLHYKPHSKLRPDFFAHKTRRWVVYPYQAREFEK